MKIVRIGSDRSISIETGCIDIVVDGINYRLTETNEGKISINKADFDESTRIQITPVVSNVIEIK